MRLPGLVRLCEGLENLALARLGSQASHPLPAQDIALLQRQVSTLLGTVATSRSAPPERRIEEYRDEPRPVEWIKPRLVWLRKRRTSY